MHGVVAVKVADLALAEVKPNSPRLPIPASTPGHDVTSCVIRSLAVISAVTESLMSGSYKLK